MKNHDEPLKIESIAIYLFAILVIIALAIYG